MKRLVPFLLGLAVGAGGTYGSLKYHLVRAEDGFHFVPKLSAEFADTYVDIREFGVGDWDEHRSLAVALARAEKGHLLRNSARNFRFSFASRERLV